MLIYKKNELKRLIRSNSLPSKVENKNTLKIIQQNGDISHLFNSKLRIYLDKNLLSKEHSKYYEGEIEQKHQHKEQELDGFKNYLENEKKSSKNKKKLFSKNNNNNSNDVKEINTESDEW